MAKLEYNHKLEIFKLHKDGRTAKEIAEILKCSLNSVYNFLKRHNRVSNHKVITKEIKVKIPKIKVKKENKTPLPKVKVPKVKVKIPKIKIKKDTTIDINKRIVSEYLLTHPCVDCGNSDIRVLEFDHVRGIKIASISKMARAGYKTYKLLEEIDKCEIRCCNCHRIVTRERRIKTN